MDTLEKYLVFRIYDQGFVVNVKHVNAIIQLPKVYKVPQAPDYIIGVINVEGDVIPLIDTGKKLDMGEIPLEELSQLIILQRQEGSATAKYHRLAFLVSNVDDVIELDTRKIQSIPTSKYEFDERLVEGMHKIDEEFCMQINIDNFYKEDLEELVNESNL